MIYMLFIVIIMNISACIQESDSVDIRYFQSWGGYKIPKVPQTEIGFEDLDSHKTYYKAYYVDNLIVKFEQYVDGDINGYDEYEYWEDSKKLKKHILVNHIGEKRIHYYNKRGQKIKE